MPTKKRTMYDHLISLYESLPIARTIYSLLLLAIIIVLIGELGSVWRHSKISISDFSYFADGKKNAEYAEQFRSETIANYSRIVGFIQADRFRIRQDDRDQRADEPESGGLIQRLIGYFKKQAPEDNVQDSDDSKLNAKEVSALINAIHAEKVSDIAKTLDITVQGINLKALVSGFSNLVAPPKTTIAASIYASDGKKRTYVSVDGDKSRIAKELTAGVSSLDTQGSDPDNAFRIACYLVWLQVNKDDGNQSRFEFDRSGISFEEFYDWARTLEAKNILRGADRYRLDDVKKSIKLDLVKQQIARAVRREIEFRAIYASLSGFEQYFPSESIKLKEGSELSMDSLADLIRYFAITRKSIGGPASRKWLDTLSPAISTRADVNKAYFARFISTDCQPNTGIDEQIIKSKSNIVQISRSQFTKETRAIGSTGLIIDNDVVLTVYSGFQSDARLSRYFKDATVRRSQCNTAGDALPVSSAAFAVAAKKSPFVLLTVPGVKLEAQNSDQDFSGFETAIPVYVAGHMTDRSLLFSPASSSNGSASREGPSIFFLSGQAVANYRSDRFEDTERRVFFDIPYAPGLVGSPIYDITGDMVGMVEGQFSAGRDLELVVGVPLTSLRGAPALAGGSRNPAETKPTKRPPSAPIPTITSSGRPD